MMFSNTTKKDGMVQKCEFYVFGNDDGAISGNATLLAQFTGLLNDAEDSIDSDLLDTDDKWQWDDRNRTDFPIAMTDLVDGQRDYTFDISFEKILGVEALDASGNYYPLLPIDARDITDMGITPTEFLESDGLPQYYDLIANSLILHPQASEDQVTLTNGLKVRLQRKSEPFVVSDTTKEPGFSRIYHKLVPLYASYDYAWSMSMYDKAGWIKNKIEEEKTKMKRFMSKRNKTERSRITAKRKRAK